MAVSMVLVPTNPEVFGVLLYSIWWTTLWPLIILGWRRDLWVLRAPLLAVGALSYPAGGALFVVFVIAYVLNRRMRELISAGILLAGFAFQIILALDSSRAELLSRDADPKDVMEQTIRSSRKSRRQADGAKGRGGRLTRPRLSWEDEVRKCAASTAPIAQIPIYFDGSTKLFWTLDLSPAECRRLAGT